MLDSKSKFFLIKIHIIFLLSVVLKDVKTTDMEAHGNEVGIRVIESGEKAMDGRKGPSMAFSPLFCIV